MRAVSDSGSGSELAVEAIDLRRAFGETKAVDGVTLNIPRGMVFGLLGPNGAGKTTVVRILCTLLRPDSGVARVARCVRVAIGKGVKRPRTRSERRRR